MTEELNGLTELTACPRCDKSPLEATEESFRCSACKVDFPSVSGIPWLFAEPDASMGEWRNRLHYALQQLAMKSQQLEAELKGIEPESLTAGRLTAQKSAVDSEREQLRELLAPVDVQSSTASYETYLAMRTRLPSDQGITTYFSNIHRDWAWGDEENAASLDIVGDVAGDAPLGDTLVLGSGASRLAYDIHQQLSPRRTVALDFNPLLLLVAKTVTDGNELTLYEFPLAPKGIDDFAVERTLKAPAAARDGFHLVLADVLRPPFGEKSFDTVITPWIIDIVNEDLPIQAARINGLLKPGGRWINFGSLAFDHPERARCYSREEALAIVESTGFAAPLTKEETIPYMCSPASRHGRRETVLAFSAIKSGDVAAPGRHRALPDWIVTGEEPVPALPAFRSQAVTTQIHAYIMSMIDGQRTIADMAAIMEQQKLMTKEEAIPAIRNFLTRMHDDSQRSTGF
jgi:uncharacterized protein YbaR (Trm112 family)